MCHEKAAAYSATSSSHCLAKFPSEDALSVRQSRTVMHPGYGREHIAHLAQSIGQRIVEVRKFGHPRLYNTGASNETDRDCGTMSTRTKRGIIASDC